LRQTDKYNQCGTIIAEYTQDYIIPSAEIERRLSRINVHKSPGRQGLTGYLTG